MLFDELEISTIKQNSELYVHANDLATHISKAIDNISNEAHFINQHVKMSIEEKMLITGILEGMANIVLMLEQGANEFEIGSINTVEELLERFRASEQ